MKQAFRLFLVSVRERGGGVVDVRTRVQSAPLRHARASSSVTMTSRRSAGTKIESDQFYCH